MFTFPQCFRVQGCAKVVNSRSLKKMENVLVLSCLLLLSMVSLTTQVVLTEPEQIHLSIGKDISEFVVTWSTVNKTATPIVEYGIGGPILRAKGVSKVFIDGGKHRKSQYIHRVVLDNLIAGETYIYRCGSASGWSAEYSFRSLPIGGDHQPHLAIYGDLGNENAKSLVHLQKDVQNNLYDMILHVGDFAYDMDWEEGAVGDAFMKQIEPIAAYLPYMTCPGNHEEKYNFSHYRERFSMPGSPDNFMYSFDLGPLHIISISTEVYYFMNYGFKTLVLQYEWLENDLKMANANREERPWIIIMGHRPMYCSTDDNDDCSHNETLTRVGLPFLHMFGLEELLHQYDVDLAIWAHEHAYERLWPIYDHQVYNGSYEAPYVNPGATVHITTGSAGCRENTDGFKKVVPPWSAFRSSEYGYTRLKAYNGTHLYLEQVSVDKGGAIIDSFTIVKESHGYRRKSG